MIKNFMTAILILILWVSSMECFVGCYNHYINLSYGIFIDVPQLKTLF